MYLFFDVDVSNAMFAIVIVVVWWYATGARPQADDESKFSKSPS